jgi:hypothetical protein
MKLPEGWPTEEMIIRGAEELHDSGVRFDDDIAASEHQQNIAESVFNAMFSAAPTPPVPVLQLETQLSDRDVKALHDYLVQVATPPAQEDQWQQAVLNECMAIEGCYKESDPERTVKCLIDWHVQNESALAQEDEPVYQSFCEGSWDDVTKERYEWAMQRGMKYYRKLYTRPQSDELRKAAEEAEKALSWFVDSERWQGTWQRNRLGALRAALDKK